MWEYISFFILTVLSMTGAVALLFLLYKALFFFGEASSKLLLDLTLVPIERVEYIVRGALLKTDGVIEITGVEDAEAITIIKKLQSKSQRLVLL